ncbi:MAG: 4-hydroxybenzoate octaprenyltransferase, partial [Stenotrophobium sp.]
LAILLAIPGALLAGSYPFMKRWIAMPQAYLGIAFSWGIPMAYAVLREPVPWTDVALLMAANFCWVIAYDTQYAMVDRADDLKIGVKSSAILFGSYDRMAVGACHALCLLLLAVTGLRAGCGAAYYGGLAAAACIAVYQQWLTWTREPQRCFRAFLNNNYFGAVIFLGLLLSAAGKI